MEFFSPVRENDVVFIKFFPSSASIFFCSSGYKRMLLFFIAFELKLYGTTGKYMRNFVIMRLIYHVYW